MPHTLKRDRRIYFGLVLAAILSGLLSRSTLIELPDFLATYAGDAIWALMVFFLTCTIFPMWNTRHIVIVALLFSFGIEFSQLYHAPWIEEIRQIKLGGLILGFGFKPSDLACYSVGITIGAGIDLFLLSRMTSSTENQTGTHL